MADPKKAGQEADRMIAELNQPVVVEDQGAVVDDVVSDQGVAKPIDVEIPVAENDPVVSKEIELLQKQVEVANQQWRVLQGMINKKDDELDQMRELLARLGDTSAQSASTPVAAGITAEDRSEFTPEMLDMVSRVAASAASDAVAKVVQKIEVLQNSVQSVSEVSHKTSADVFDDALTRRVPDWKQINIDPDFMAWLNVVDVFSGSSKLALLNNAYGNSDLQRTAKFFEAYKAEKAPAPATTPDTKSVVKLDISPKKSGGTLPAEEPKKIWTQAAIAKLYSDQRNGKLTPEDYKRLEEDLFKAQGENRLAA